MNPTNDSVATINELAYEAARLRRPQMLKAALVQGLNNSSTPPERDSLVRCLLNACATARWHDQNALSHSLDNDAKCLLLILEAGGDLNLNEQDGQNALHFAARNLPPSYIEMLLDHGAELNAQTISGLSAFHIAIAQGKESIASVLFERGADPDLSDFEGSTPLHTAAVSDNPQAILWLLQMGASTTAVNEDGLSPWQLCETAIGSDDIWNPILKKAFIEGEAKEVAKQMETSVKSSARSRSL